MQLPMIITTSIKVKIALVLRAMRVFFVCLATAGLHGKIEIFYYHVCKRSYSRKMRVKVNTITVHIVNY